MSELTQRFSGNSDDLEKAYQRIQRENVKLREQTQDLARASKAGHAAATQGADEQGNAIGKVIPKLTELVGGYLTMRGAVSAVNAEIQHQIALQAEAAAAQLKQADPRAGLLQNLGDVSPAELAAVKQGIRATALKGYGTIGTLEKAYGELASASPTLDNEQRQQALEVAARFAPQEEALPTIAAGLADTSKVTGSNDAMENLGVMAATAARSRATSPAAIAEHTMPAAANIRSIGGASAAEALSLVTAIQNSIVDVEGRVSGTAATGLAEQLKAHFEAPTEDDKSTEDARKEVLQKLRHEAHLPAFEQPDDVFRAKVNSFFENLTAEQRVQYDLRGKLPETAEGQLDLLKHEHFRPLAGEFVEQELAGRRALTPEQAGARAEREYGKSDRVAMEAYLNREETRNTFDFEGPVPHDRGEMVKLIESRAGMKENYLQERAEAMAPEPPARQEFTPEQARARVERDFGGADRQKMGEYLSREDVRKTYGIEDEEISADSGEMAKLMERTPEMKENYLAERAKAVEAEGGAARPTNLDDQIRYMQEHPEEREEFLKTASFEVKPREQIRQLLRDKDSDVAQQYESMKKEGIPTGEAARELAEQQLERQEQDPLLRSQRLQRGLTNAAEINKQDSEGKGMAGIAREQLADMLDSTGVGGARKLVEKISFEAKTGFGQVGALEELMTSVQRRRQELEHPVEEETNLWRRFTGTGPHHGQFRDRAPTAEETKQAETLAGILPLLREMIDEQKKTSAVIQKQSAENAAASRQNGARAVAARSRGME